MTGDDDAAPESRSRRAFLARGAGVAAAVAGIGVGGNASAGADGTAAGRPARTTAQSSGGWRSFKNGPANTSHAPDQSAPIANVEAAWTFDAGAPVRTAPAVVGGALYVGADDGYMYAVDAASGAFQWRYGTTSTVSSPPVVAGGTVVFGVRDAAVHALSTDGTREWVYTFGDGQRARVPPAVRDGTVYCGTFSSGVGRTYALDLASGERRWRQFDVAPGGSPTPVGDRVRFGDVGSRGPSAVTLEAGSGSVAEREYTSLSAPTTPTVVDGRTYLPAADGFLVLDPEIEVDGKYTVYLEDRTLATSVAVAADTLFAADDAGTVLAIDPAQLTDNRIRWQFDTGSEVRRAPIVAGATLFVGCTDGTVYALDASTGEQRWQFDAGDAVEGGLAVVDGTLFVPGTDGTVYGLTGETSDATLTSVEGTPTPTPTPTPSPTPDPTPTRTPAPTATPSPTATPPPTDPPSASPTPTPGGGRSGGGDGGDGDDSAALVGSATPTGDRRNAAGGGGETVLPEVGPTELLSGVGGVAVLGGGLLAARRVLGDDAADEPGDGAGPAGSGSASGPGPDSGTEPTTTADGSSPAGTDGVAAEASVSPAGGTGSASAGGGPGGDSRAAPDDDQDSPATVATEDADGDGPETVDVDALAGEGGTDPVGSLSYDDIEQVGELGGSEALGAYEALVPTPDGERRVVLRQPHFEGTLDAAAVERFAEAAETWAALGEHDNVVGVVDWGTEPLPWLALEPMDGHLGTVAGDLPVDRAVAVATGVVEGLHHGHSRGVTHLALCPEAVLLDGDGARPAVGDWKLGAMFDGGSERAVTGGPAYAAPEQFDGEDAGRATDVYGLGATLYELFTGRAPFDGPAETVAGRTRSGTVPRPTVIDDTLPDGIDECLARAMALDPADRYESVLYLRDDLRELG